MTHTNESPGFPGRFKYYEAIARVMLERAKPADSRLHELAREFDRTVGRIHELAGAAERVPLGENSLVV